MAKLNARQALEDYKGGNNDFFKLEKDMETAQVRFLYESEEDLDVYAVHEVEIKGKKRYIECLQTSDCPLCVEGAHDKDLKVKVKFFLQLEDEDGKVKTWERGQKFITKILGMINKYGPLCNRLYEIERHGKPNDTNTTYELYALDKDDSVLEDLPEKQELLGDFVLQWNYDQMNVYLDGGEVETPAEPAPPARGASRAPKGKAETTSQARAPRGTRATPPAEAPPARGSRGTAPPAQEKAPRSRGKVADEDVF